MSQWREVEVLLVDGKQKLQAAQLQMQQVSEDLLTDIDQLLELNQGKPTAEWVFSLQKLITENNLEGPAVQKLENELTEMAESITNYIDFLRNYRTQKESFRSLILGCTNKQIDFQAYKHSLKEWERIKELLVESPLHDTRLVREFVALDCLFQIMHFTVETSDRDYDRVKLAVSSLISKWDAEDLIMENDANAGLLSSFLSNQKDRFSLLGKRESQTRTVSQKPAMTEQVPGLARRKRPLPLISSKPSTEKVFKERKDCFPHKKVYTSTKRFSSPLALLETTCGATSEANDCSKTEPTDQNQLSHLSKSLTNYSYEELCESVKDKNLAQQQKEVIARNYERVRKEAKDTLMEVIRMQFKEELAVHHVNKLEAEIFALFYYCLETYKEKTQHVTKSLRALFQNGDPLDCMMATALDYNSIMKKTPHIGYITEESNMDWINFNLAEPELENVSRLRSDSMSDHASSGLCDEIENRVPLNAIYLEELSSLADKLDKESVSFEFLEELTKIKEEEIKKLKDIMVNLQKENDLLTDALLEVRTHLIALESNEITLDTLPGT